jgi:hypothetical protein
LNIPLQESYREFRLGSKTATQQINRFLMSDGQTKPPHLLALPIVEAGGLEVMK